MELKYDLARYREMLRVPPDGVARSPLLLMVEYLERQLRDFQKSAPQLARRELEAGFAVGIMTIGRNRGASS